MDVDGTARDVPKWSLFVPDFVGYGIELCGVEIFWPLEKRF